MTTYYQNKDYVSCSTLKAAMRKHKGEPEPDWSNSPAIQFGSCFDALLTEPDFKSEDWQPDHVEKAKQLAIVYHKRTALPFGKADTTYQHEFYRHMDWRFEEATYSLKMRGRTDIFYPTFYSRVVEDLKSTSLKTQSSNAIYNLISRFDWDMQIAVYMNLSKAQMGVLSICSHTGMWVHQVFVEKGSDTYARGMAKLEEHLKVWFNC